MFENVNLRSAVPVYEQIENFVLFAIASGDLKVGDKLPPVKVLAQRLGVNFNTVTKSYRDLEIMGLIVARRGMGCFIKKGAHARVRESCRTRIVTRIFEVVQETKASGFSKQQLSGIISESLSVDEGLYSDAPPSVKALIKQKK